MSARSSVVLALLSFVVLGSTATPAEAQSDTTPPQLVSLSVAPTQVDPSSSAQSVIVTAVITDDLSGVCEASGTTPYCSTGTTAFDLLSPSGQQRTAELFRLVSGDTYTATATIAQFAERGIWRNWGLFLDDRAGNEVFLDETDLLALGMNVAVGVGTFEAVYARTILLKLGNRSARIQVGAAAESTCSSRVPILLQLKTKSGWKKVGSALTSNSGRRSIPIHKAGKYRATATEFGLGTPTVTTCSKASVVRTSS